MNSTIEELECGISSEGIIAIILITKYVSNLILRSGDIHAASYKSPDKK